MRNVSQPTYVQHSYVCGRCRDWELSFEKWLTRRRRRHERQAPTIDQALADSPILEGEVESKGENAAVPLAIETNRGSISGEITHSSIRSRRRDSAFLSPAFFYTRRQVIEIHPARRAASKEDNGG